MLKVESPKRSSENSKKHTESSDSLKQESTRSPKKNSNEQKKSLKSPDQKKKEK